MLDGLKRRVAVSGLAALLGAGTIAGSQGCISVREGDDRISAVASPFGVSAIEEKYESGTNKVIGKRVQDVTIVFGNVHREVKFYGPDKKYRGGYKVKYDGVFGGNPRITTDVYNSRGKVIKTYEGEQEPDIDFEK